MKLTIPNLTPGQRYAIQLRAEQGGRLSEWSTKFEHFIPVPSVPPLAPTGVALNLSGDAFVVTWDAVTKNTAGLDVHNPYYEVKWTSFSSGTRIVSAGQIQGATGSLALNFEDNKAFFTAPSSVIDAAVRAVDATGLAGEWSTGTVNFATTPTSPAGLTATAGSDSIMLNWTASSSTNISAYKVYVGTTAGFTPTSGNIIYEGPATSFTYVTTNYSTQYFKVFAVNRMNLTSAASAAASAAAVSPFTLDTTPPSNTTGLAVTVTNNANGVGAKAQASWSAVVASDVRGYILYYREKGSLNWSTLPTEATAVQVELQKAYTVYEFLVKVEDWANNKSTGTSIVESGSTTLAVPVSPGAITATAGRYDLTTKWPAIAATNIVGYSVQIDTASGFTSSTPQYVGNTTSFTFGGLTPATTYYVRVRGRDAKGQDGAWSSGYPFNTLAQITPGAIGAATPADINNVELELTEYVISRGTDLVTNGTGYLGDNTNFKGLAPGSYPLAYTSVDAPTGVNGSFVTPTKGVRSVLSDEILPVDPSKKLVMTSWLRETSPTAGGSYGYTGFSPYDAYGLNILPQHYVYRSGTTTTLTQELKAGDTVVKVASTANWTNSAGAATHWRTIIWWDYTDPGGKLWPVETYSRNFNNNAYPDGGITDSTTITLSAPWAGPTKPVGTKLSNGGSGGTYIYTGLGNGLVPTTWTRYQSALPITGTHTMPPTPGTTPLSASTSWPAGTAGARLVFLLNRLSSGVSNTESQMAIAGISVSDATAAQQAADEAYTRWAPTGVTTIDGGKITADSITAAQIRAGTITAEKLTVKGDNLIADEGFDTLPPNPHWSGWPVVAGAGRTGNALAITNTSVQNSTYNASTNEKILANKDDRFHVSFWVKNVGMDIPVNGVALGIRGTVSAGNYVFPSGVSNGTVIPANTWARVYGVAGAFPNQDVKSISVYLASQPTLNTGTLYIDSVHVSRAATGEVIVDGSITAYKLDAEFIKGKEFTVKTGGAIKSDNYSANTSGWKISQNGIEVNNGEIKADAIRTGNLGGPAGTTSNINIANDTNLIVNGGVLRSQTYGGNVHNPAATSGFLISNDKIHIPDGDISAKAIKSGTIDSQTITLANGGKVVGGGFELSSGGLTIPNGAISAASLNIQTGSNLVPDEVSVFQLPENVYSNAGGFTSVSRISSAQGIGVTSIVTPGKFGTQALRHIAGAGNTGNIHINLAPTTTTYNVSVEAAKSYIVSAYLWNPTTISTNVSLKVKFSNGNVAALTGANAVVTLPASGAPTSAVRAYGQITIPAGVDKLMVYLEQTTQTNGSGFCVDGVKVEQQLTSASTPSSFDSPVQTMIDGNLIRTGSLVSNTTGEITVKHVDAEGKDIIETESSGQPAFMINTGGYATFTGLNILGNTVLGLTGQPFGTNGTTKNITMSITTNGTTTITSATDSRFTQSDVNAEITGSGIVSGTTIDSISEDGLTATTSAAATNSTTANRVIARNVQKISSISSADYVPGTRGWSVRSDGFAEFRNLGADSISGDAIRAGTLRAESISGGVIDADLTITKQLKTEEIGERYIYAIGASGQKYLWVYDIYSRNTKEGFVGKSVRGAGIPNGATIVAYASNVINGIPTLTLELSANATAAVTHIVIEDKSHIEISPAGINFYGLNSATPEISLPTTGEPARFSGRISTDNLSVAGGLALSGTNNEVGGASRLVLSTGSIKSPETVKITPTWPAGPEWDKDISRVTTTSLIHTNNTGIAMGTSNTTYSVSNPDFTNPRISAYNSTTGEHLGLSSERMLGNILGANYTRPFGMGEVAGNRVVVLTSNYGWYINNPWRLVLVDLSSSKWSEGLSSSTLPASAKISEARLPYPVVGTGSTNFLQVNQPGLATDGTNVYVARVDSNGNLYFARYSTANPASYFGTSAATNRVAVAAETATVNTPMQSGIKAHIANMSIGTFDFGGSAKYIQVTVNQEAAGKAVTYFVPLSGTTPVGPVDNNKTFEYQSSPVTSTLFNGTEFISIPRSSSQSVKHTTFRSDAAIGEVHYKARWVKSDGMQWTDEGELLTPFQPPRRVGSWLVAVDGHFPYTADNSINRVGFTHREGDAGTWYRTALSPHGKSEIELSNIATSHGFTAPTTLANVAPGEIFSPNPATGQPALLSIKGDGSISGSTLSISGDMTTQSIPLFSGACITGPSIPNAVWTAVPFTPISPLQDTRITRNTSAVTKTLGSWTGTVPANGLFTVPTAGVYLIEAQARWEGASTAGGRGVRILSTYKDVVNYSGAATFPTMSVVSAVRLDAGSEIVIIAYQSSGTGMALYTGAEVSTTASITRIGS